MSHLIKSDFCHWIRQHWNSNAPTAGNCVCAVIAASFMFSPALTGQARAQTAQLQQIERSNTGRAKLEMRFLHEGRPIKANVIIANEDSRLEFSDVTDLVTEAPRRATYTITADLTGEGRTTFKDVIPIYEIPDDGADLEVHFPSENTVKDYDPFLLFKENGARLKVANTMTSEPKEGASFDLSTVVRGETGKRFILDTVLSTGSAANSHSCEAPCLHAYPTQTQIDCSIYCYTCSTTADLQGNVWKENFNMCEGIITPTSGGGLDPNEEDGVFEITSKFQPLPGGEGGVILGVALRNDAALFPSHTKIQAVDNTRQHVLTPPFTTRAYPDFIAPAGDYIYSVTVPDPDAANGSLTYSLPISLTDQQIMTLLLNLPAVAELEPLEAYILGDTRLGIALMRARVSKASAHRYRLKTDLDDARHDTGWMAVALPAGSRSVRVRQTRGERKGALEEGRDFIVAETGAVTLVTLSVDPGASQFIITRR